MKTIAALLVTAALALVLTGCTAYKHNKAGDAAARTGDMRSAVYHYERAMANKERYSRDSDFLSKLAVAKSRVSYDDARRSRSEGRYEQALDQLRESMRQDPNYAEPSALLPVVLKEAAHWRYTQAVAAADHGNLDAARDHLMRAMQHDMTDEAVAYAMASLNPEALRPDTPGLSAYREGLSKAAERRWLLAEQTQLKSVALNAGLLPARAALSDARDQLAEARRLQRDGRALIGQLTMSPAIKSLTQSLSIWPHNPQASELLAKAKAQQALANEQFEKATQAAGQAKWDDAIALADSGLAIDRSHPALGELRGALPRRAAADHTHRGDGHLEKGDLDTAHQSYARALTYRDTYREARLGMSYVYTKWAKQHEQAGRLGAALLNYAKGRSYTRSKALDDGSLKMRAAIRDRLDVGIAVSADAQRRGAIDPRQLSGALIGSLQSKQSRGLAVQGQGQPYALRLSIAKADIDERRTNTSRRTHHYTTQELRHNPEYDRVARELRHEESALRSIESRLSSFRCSGHIGDMACDCFSSSRYNSLKSSASHQRRVVDRLRHKLSCTPRQIKVTLHHDWPYTVETYTKTGELKVHTELIDTASGKPVKSFTHQASFAQSDDRTLNANPSVGVRHDDLNLHSDGYVSNALTAELATAAGPWAVNALVDHRLAQISAAITAFDDAGKTDQALEARVDSAVLLGIVDPKASQRSLDKLTQTHTR
jgi:tetratricopeptide (TPR) repeat protein